MRILITGADQYLGGMLADQFARGPGAEVVAIDPTKDDWQGKVILRKPDVAIHGAPNGAEKLFEFCFQNGIKKLIHLSSFLAYGAFPSNSLERPFIENDPLRETKAIDGSRKREEELILKQLYGRSAKLTQVFIVRPAMVTGPRGRGLRSINSPRFYFNPDWTVQLLHEDDLIDAIGILAFNKIPERYAVFNLAPADFVTLKDLSAAAKKFPLKLSEPAIHLIQFLLRLFETDTMSPYSIPIDGSKITRQFKFNYHYSSKDALTTNEGRYAGQGD